MFLYQICSCQGVFLKFTKIKNAIYQNNQRALNNSLDDLNCVLDSFFWGAFGTFDEIAAK